MARLYMMVGLPGVGKTHMALRLAHDLPALRLSADDLHLALFGDEAADPLHNRRHAIIEAELWVLALAALRAGADVILDFGFWSRQEREDFRARAAAAGFGSCLRSPVDPGGVTRLLRIATRDKGFTISAAQMQGYEAAYEPPGSDEWDDRPPP